MDFYEKYWRKEGDTDAVAARPPEWNEKDLRRVMDAIRPFCQGSGLDVGSGNGTFTDQLTRVAQVDRMVGVDVSHTAVETAARLYRHVQFETFDGGKLPFADRSFDFVTLIEVIEHLLDPEALLAEIRRVLKDEGFFIITTTDFNWPKKVLIAACCWEKYFHPCGPHIRFFTRRSLARLLKKSGFQVKAYRWNGSYFGLMPKGQITVARKEASSPS